ncbi:MAG: RICIN domain-containing protein [Acidobacteriota bacterium]|nr:RICIN domain-containing protein [Acidobacteriota bacterium]
MWNAPIDKLPVDANSAAYIVSMNATNNKVHPDFGYGGGMPYNVVPGTQAKVPVSFYYNGDPGPYPIPSNVNIEGGSDHHAILIDNTNCVLYELFNLSGHSTGWQAGSGAIWSLNSNALRPAGWTSADAAGLPIFPGLVRYDEILAGHIDHALRVTVDHTRNTYIWPARHAASYLTGSQYPPMGQRFRLKSTFDITPYPEPVQIILQAMKTYGLILADNGTSWHLSGVGDTRWNDDVMHQLTLVTGNNFEAVDESSLMVNSESAEASGSVPLALPTGWVNVISKNTGKCLDLTGGPAATWQTDPAQQWTCIGSAQTNQQFQFKPVTGGYEMEVKNSELALQPTGGTSAVAGAIIEQWPFISQPFQVWSVTRSTAGYFNIHPQNSSLCLDVSGASKIDGAPVQQWTCNGGDNQAWSFVAVP